MIDASEHIQEYLSLEGAEALSDEDVAMGVADIMLAQGLIRLDQVDLAVHEIQQEVSYYRLTGGGQ